MATRILVIEDGPQNLYLVKYLLERDGYEVVIAHDGEQGVEVAKDTHLDLVLMDMLLPRMDGYTATRLIKGTLGLEDTKVVALTAYSMKGDKIKVLESGCEGYIPKPIEPSTFVAEVAKYLTQERP